MSIMFRFDVFGKMIGVMSVKDGWRAYYLGSEGKFREAQDILIPSTVPVKGIAPYLADLLHESATPEHPNVRRLA
jgi:hypothetical protein